MKRQFSLPFRTASTEFIELEPWHFKNQNGFDERVGKALPGWDYNLNIELSRKLKFDGGLLRRECGLSAKEKLALVITAKSPSARYSEVLKVLPFPSKPVTDDIIEVKIESAILAQSVKIITSVLLAGSGGQDSPFSAYLPGSRLFEETTIIELENTASRFPVESADFEKELAFLNAPRARYYLQYDLLDLDNPVLSSVILFMNSRYPEFIEEASSPDTTASALLSADIARQLITIALDLDDFTRDPGRFEDGSLGATIYNLIRAAFPDRSIRSIIDLRKSDRSRFESMIQDSCGV